MYKSKITQRNKQRSLFFHRWPKREKESSLSPSRTLSNLTTQILSPLSCGSLSLTCELSSILFTLNFFLSYWSYQFAFDIGSFFFFFLVPLRFCGVITGSHEESVEIMRFLLNIWQILEPDSHIWFVGNNVFVTMSMIIALILKDSWSNYSVLISQPFLSLMILAPFLRVEKLEQPNDIVLELHLVAYLVIQS